MNTWSDLLANLLIPPTTAIPVQEENLRRNEEELGISFPSDFVAFARRYGSGLIRAGYSLETAEYSDRSCSFEIASPFDYGWKAGLDQWYRDNYYFRDGYTTAGVLGLFPEPNGLIPFGGPAFVSDFHFGWKTSDASPEDWPVMVLWDYKADGFVTFEMGFAEFWVRFLRRDITINLFNNSSWNPKDVSFEPFPLSSTPKPREPITVATLQKELSSIPAICPLSPSDVDRLKQEFPGLPEDYWGFMAKIGWGDFGDFMILERPVAPKHVVPPSDHPPGIILVGFDAQGDCFGFDTKERSMLIEISAEGCLGLYERTSFLELINEKLSDQQAR